MIGLPLNQFSVGRCKGVENRMEGIVAQSWEELDFCGGWWSGGGSVSESNV